MQKKLWFQGSITYKGAVALDDFAGLIMEAGAQAVNLLDHQHLDFYIELSQSELDSFLSQPIFSQCESVNVKEVVQENWVQKCGDLFEPVDCNGLKIIPLISAEDRTKYTDDKAIYLIPGMGFGSGHHPTSQMIIKLMQEQIKPQSILDCGTGSGILSIAAKHLFNCEIHAFDNDEQALINARENFSLNNFDRIKLTLNSVEQITGQYDLILANLYLELLKKFKNDFIRLMKPESKLLVSGITADQATELKEFYSDLTMAKELNINNWHAFQFQLGDQN